MSDMETRLASRSRVITHRGRAIGFILPSLLVLHWLLAVCSISTKSCTFDELAHVTAGTAYWTQNDYRLQPENGNLPQRIAALLPVVAGYALPPLDGLRSWHVSDVWGVGTKFFYDSGNDADRLLLWSRATMGLVSVALGWLVYAITRNLFGSNAAVLAVLLFAFCPTMLANGPLATSDVTAAFFFLASVWQAWRLLHCVSVGNMMLSAGAVSGLFLAKYSAPLVIPVIAILVGIRLVAGGPLAMHWRGETSLVTDRPRQAGILVGIVAWHVLVAWMVVWLAYGFRYDAFAAGKPGQDMLSRDWQSLFEGTGTVGRSIAAVREQRILPEAYLFGYAFTYKMAQKRVAFFNGDFGVDGWRGFFPYCLLVKTPLPLFVLMGLGFAALAARQVGRNDAPSTAHRLKAVAYRSAPLWVFFAIYWAAAISSHLNIGHRHILPTYPPMFVAAGAAAQWLKPRSGVRSWATVLAACLFVTESLLTAPNYLAYFNVVAGGSRNGYRHLVDSSLDWGQDLPALKHWLGRHASDDTGKGRVYVSYFGSALPQHYRIDAVWLPCFFEIQGPHEPPPLLAGTYCISATMLQNVYTTFRGPWNRDHEILYQQLVPFIKRFNDTTDDRQAREELVKEYGVAEWKRAFAAFEHARFARLCSFLRRREPDASINHSILVYRLNDAEIDAALNGPPP